MCENLRFPDEFFLIYFLLRMTSNTLVYRFYDVRWQQHSGNIEASVWTFFYPIPFCELQCNIFNWFSYTFLIYTRSILYRKRRMFVMKKKNNNNQGENPSLWSVPVLLVYFLTKKKKRIFFSFLIIYSSIYFFRKICNKKKKKYISPIITIIVHTTYVVQRGVWTYTRYVITSSFSPRLKNAFELLLFFLLCIAKKV